MPTPSNPRRTKKPAVQIAPVDLVTPTNPASALVAAIFEAIQHENLELRQRAAARPKATPKPAPGAGRASVRIEESAARARPAKRPITKHGHHAKR